MGVYTRPSRGVQGMSIRILLACQWLFIDNSLNWVMQPSPRGSLTSSRRMHIYDLCIVLVDHLCTSHYATRCLGGDDLTWPMCTSRYAAWCFWYVLSLLKPLQLCDALVPSWNLMFACAVAVLFEAKFGDSVYRRSVRINLLRLMFSNHHVTIWWLLEKEKYVFRASAACVGSNPCKHSKHTRR